MKKNILAFLLSLFFLSCVGGASSEYNLGKMGQSFRAYLQKKDIDNNTVTQIEYLKPISYIEIAEADRKNANEAYSCKIYIQGKWSYMDSNRIYNMDDTLTCYFDKERQFLRVEEK